LSQLVPFVTFQKDSSGFLRILLNVE
jgi:hypothetical protein